MRTNLKKCFTHFATRCDNRTQIKSKIYNFKILIHKTVANKYLLCAKINQHSYFYVQILSYHTSVIIMYLRKTD